MYWLKTAEALMWTRLIRGELDSAFRCNQNPPPPPLGRECESAEMYIQKGCICIDHLRNVCRRLPWHELICFVGVVGYDEIRNLHVNSLDTIV